MPMPKLSSNYPERGDIYIANLEPGFGREMHKKRPVAVISSDNLNQETNHVVIVPASSRTLAPNSDIVLIGTKEGVDKPSILLPVFIRSIDQARLIKKVGKLSKAKLAELEESVRLVLGLNLES